MLFRSPEVRQHLLKLQRDMGEKNNIIMDGRDIGTVVLPNASLKIFLIASLDERAQRRYDELLEKGLKVTYEEVKEQMAQRDYNDSNRPVAPLKPSETSVVVDTTGTNVIEAYDMLLKLVRERLF